MEIAIGIIFVAILWPDVIFLWQVYFERGKDIIRKYHYQMDPFFNDL
jgi:hypothetical protein